MPGEDREMVGNLWGCFWVLGVGGWGLVELKTGVSLGWISRGEDFFVFFLVVLRGGGGGMLRMSSLLASLCKKI